MARHEPGHHDRGLPPASVRSIRTLAGATVVGLLVAVGPAGPARADLTRPAIGWSAALTTGETPSDGTPADPPSTEPAPTDSATPQIDPTTTSAAPTIDSPSPTSPLVVSPTMVEPSPTTPPPLPPTPPAASRTPGQPGQQQPGVPVRGIYVTTDDITLNQDYWGQGSTIADLRVTVANTGAATELVRLGYSMPAGLTDAGTRGCAASGRGSWECAPWTVAPGARFSTHLRVRVDGDAWRRMPLSGSVRASATMQGFPTLPMLTDSQGFAVLFPPGPPVPGVALSASEVSFDVTGQATTLVVRLGNTGRVDTTGTIEVVLPPGVTVPAPPLGCVALATDRTRCDMGAIPAGRFSTARLPVAATAEAQREAPLSGAVIGTLTPRAGKARQVQMSFRIVAVAALSTPAPATGATPTGSQGALPPVTEVGKPDGGMTSVQKTAVALIGASILLVVLALTLATTSLRRRLGLDPPPLGETPTPAPAE